MNKPHQEKWKGEIKAKPCSCCGSEQQADSQHVPNLEDSMSDPSPEQQEERNLCLQMLIRTRRDTPMT